MPALFGVVSNMFNGGIVLKGRLQKKVIIITFRGGVARVIYHFFWSKNYFQAILDHKNFSCIVPPPRVPQAP